MNPSITIRYFITVVCACVVGFVIGYHFDGCYEDLNSYVEINLNESMNERQVFSIVEVIDETNDGCSVSLSTPEIVFIDVTDDICKHLALGSLVTLKYKEGYFRRIVPLRIELD